MRGDLLQQKVCYPEDQATYAVGREGDSQVGIYFANLFSGCEETAAACLRAELQTEPVLISSHYRAECFIGLHERHDLCFKTAGKAQAFKNNF